MSKMMTHLGDGAYAVFDGYYIWVKAERDGITHAVALEPDALRNLNWFANTAWKKESPNDQR
jgi:hypothetical protein